MLQRFIGGNLIIKERCADIGRENVRTPMLSSLIASFFNCVGDRGKSHFASKSVADNDFDDVGMRRRTRPAPSFLKRVPSHRKQFCRDRFQIFFCRCPGQCLVTLDPMLQLFAGPAGLVTAAGTLFRRF